MSTGGMQMLLIGDVSDRTQQYTRYLGPLFSRHRCAITAKLYCTRGRKHAPVQFVVLFIWVLDLQGHV